VSLLDEEGKECSRGLLAVPRTTAGRAQRSKELDDPAERRRESRSVGIADLGHERQDRLE
jgi:hypothetical protein